MERKFYLSREYSVTEDTGHREYSKEVFPTGRWKIDRYGDLNLEVSFDRSHLVRRSTWFFTEYDTVTEKMVEWVHEKNLFLRQREVIFKCNCKK